MNPASSVTTHSSRAAAALGVGIALLGVVLGLASLYMASTLSAFWLLLMLPAVFLAVMGAAIYANRFDVGHVPRLTPRKSDSGRMDRVQDYAHTNKAWENVSRWKSKYNSGRPGGRGSPDQSPEKQSLESKIKR